MKSVVANWRYAVSLTAACAVFAVLYRFLRPAAPFERRLAWAHFATMAFGSALIVSPMWVLAFAGLTSGSDAPVEVFTWTNRASTTGYAVSLLGLLIFAVLLADKAARALLRPRSG